MSPLQSIFTYSVKNKTKIIRLFQVLYTIIILLLAIALYANFQKLYVVELYILSIWAGRIALILFVIVILPGMMRRFGLSWPIRNIIMLFRRQIGILVFGMVFLHFALLLLFPTITGQSTAKLPFPMFITMGLSALYLLTVMFFTSNDLSVRKLGKWWTRIHRVVYVIAWMIFFHVYLQGKESWAILIGLAALFETLSLIYFYLIPKKTSPPTPPVVPPQQPPSQIPSNIA